MNYNNLIKIVTVGHQKAEVGENFLKMISANYHHSICPFDAPKSGANNTLFRDQNVY
jgi:hypothetical protein